MKKILLVLAMAGLMVGCGGSGDQTTEAPAKSGASSSSSSASTNSAATNAPAK